MGDIAFQTPAFLNGGGEMGERIRAHDWSKTQFGPPETWPQPLRSALLICLNMPVVSAIHWGPDLRTLYNDACVPALAERHPWALGQPFSEVWAEIWDVLDPQIASVIDTGRGFSTERQLLRMNRNGRPEDMWWVYSFAPLYIDDGSVGGIFVTALDETDKALSGRQTAKERDRMHLAQEALRDSEARFRALVNASSDVVYRMSPDWTEMRQLDGRGFLADTEQPSVRWLDEYLFAEDRPHVSAVIDEAVRAKSVFELEHRVRRVDGTAGWTFSRAVPVLGAQGKVVEWFGMASDVTERKRTEDRLVESEARYRTLFETVDEGFCVIEFIDGPHGPLSDYVHVEANPAYTANAGIPDIVGKRLREIVGDDEADAWAETYRRVAVTGDPIRFVRELLATRRYLELAAFRIEPPERRQVAVLFKDVTDRMRGEARKAVLVELSDAIRDTENPDDLAQAASKILGLALDVSGVGYVTIDPDTETLHVEGDWNAPSVESLSGVLKLRDYGPFIDSLKRGEFISIRDVREDERTAAAAAALESRSARSFVNMPVVEQGRLGAVLYVNHAEARDWTPDDLALVREVGERTRTAVERSRTDIALRESEARYRTLFENIDTGFCVIEMLFDEAERPVDYRFIEVNPAFAAQTDLVDAIGRRMLEFAPDMEQHWFDTYGSIALTGVPQRFENEAAALGRWYEVDAFRVGEPEQRRVAVLFNDVSERKRVEARIRELNETLEQRVAERTAERDRVWKLSRDPLLIADAQGHWISASPAWSDILGWSHAELVGRTSEWMEHPDDRKKTREEVDHLAIGGVTMRFENRFRTKNGEYRWFAWTAVKEGELLYATARDITEDKERQAELGAAQEQLRQSQKMEAVGQLTGGLAHDFNNLLAGISGSLEMMQTRIQQGRIRELDKYMVGAQGAARRAAALTHRLLAFSRRQTLEPKPTDVNRLVVDMEDLIRHTVGPQITLETVAKAGLWSTLVDPNQLENALLNLCLNARDAMPNGGQIIVETGNRWLDERAAKERDLAPGQYVSMCVSDNGTGMPRHVVERAFDPFFTTKPIGVGTGLGLSMIYGFARQSGGQVRIYSEVGNGTMVCVYLPRHGEGEATEAMIFEQEAARAEIGQSVLIIDDESLVRMLVVDVLEELGYTTIEAGDGPQGMKIIRSGARIDLLITDVGLPNGMNGRQVADAAREIRPGLKVLFMTGYAENAVLSHGHLDPGMQVVTKPFEVNMLAKKIQELIAE